MLSEKDLRYNKDMIEPSRDELDAMKLDVSLYPNETEEQTARRLFREALPQAVLGLVDIATNSSNDRTRLTACQYIVERNMGKVGDDPAHVKTDILEGIVADLEESLRKEGQI